MVVASETNCNGGVKEEKITSTIPIYPHKEDCKIKYPYMYGSNTKQFMHAFENTDLAYAIYRNNMCH